MKTIELTGAGMPLDDVLRVASEENVLLKAVDGSEYIIVPIDDFDDEIARTLANEALMAVLDERRKSKDESIPLEEVYLRLGWEIPASSTE